MPTRSKAYSYIRFSSAPQGKGDSVRRQTENSHAYALKNGLDLDTTLNLRDLGLSAFDGSNIEKGALGAFLQAIREKRIPKGSYLLVESLDRISRAQIMEALAVFTQIINAGIVIVTLIDEMVYSSERLADDPMPLIMSIMVMIRAHEESATKSKRVRQSWAKKRQRLGSEKMTRTCPSWMELDEARKAFRLIPEKVRVVKRILKLQREGIGQSSIVRTLNKERVPLIQTRVPSESWHQSTIQKIVTNPALYGAYQPTVGIVKDKKRKRIAHGDVVENYYPSIITKDDFYLLQQGRKDRITRGRGAKGQAFANIFSGLLHCGYCGGKMTIAGHSSANRGLIRYLVCSRAKRGMDCYFVMWTYHLFERMILTFCEGLDFAKLLDEGIDAKGLYETQFELQQALRGKRNEDQEKLDRWVAAIESGDPPVAALKRIRELEEALAEADKAIADADKKLVEIVSLRQDAKNIKASTIDLFKQFDTKSGDALYLLRAKLAAQLKRVILRIEVFPGGYLMTKDEWNEFTSGIPARAIKEEKLERLMQPEKSQRYAIIKGINAKSIPTYNIEEAREKGKIDKAELLQQLAVKY